MEDKDRPLCRIVHIPLTESAADWDEITEADAERIRRRTARRRRRNARLNFFNEEPFSMKNEELRMKNYLLIGNVAAPQFFILHY